MLNNRPLLLDASRLIWRRWVGRLPTGIDRVCLAYVKRYGDEAQAVVQGRGFRRILNEAASDRLYEILLSPGLRFKADLSRLLAREALRASSRLPGRGRLYLNIGHTGLEDGRFLRWARSGETRPIYMVHDLIPITHPEYCRAGEEQRHSRRIKAMLLSASGVMGNSQATIDSLHAFAAEQQIDAPPTLPALLGADVLLPTSRRSEETRQRPYFVMVGTIEGRKNHLLILQLWSRMVRALGSRAPRLLVIGQRGWECEQVFDLLDRSGSLRAAVTEIPACSDAELARHLHGACALLFPSLVEGFGLPLVEALAAGTPVIASDLAVFREIGRDVPDFLDPLDGPGWERAILDYAREDSPARRAQLARLSSYAAPTWDEHFSVVDGWLSTLEDGTSTQSLSAML